MRNSLFDYTVALLAVGSTMSARTLFNNSKSPAEDMPPDRSASVKRRRVMDDELSEDSETASFPLDNLCRNVEEIIENVVSKGQTSSLRVHLSVFVFLLGEIVKDSFRISVKILGIVFGSLFGIFRKSSVLDCDECDSAPSRRRYFVSEENVVEEKECDGQAERIFSFGISKTLRHLTNSGLDLLLSPEHKLKTLGKNYLPNFIQSSMEIVRIKVTRPVSSTESQTSHAENKDSDSKDVGCQISSSEEQSTDL